MPHNATNEPRSKYNARCAHLQPIVTGQCVGVEVVVQRRTGLQHKHHQSVGDTGVKVWREDHHHRNQHVANHVDELSRHTQRQPHHTDKPRVLRQTKSR